MRATPIVGAIGENNEFDPQVFTEGERYQIAKDLHAMFTNPFQLSKLELSARAERIIKQKKNMNLFQLYDFVEQKFNYFPDLGPSNAWEIAQEAKKVWGLDLNVEVKKKVSGE